jgi:hypothetical protein
MFVPLELTVLLTALRESRLCIHFIWLFFRSLAGQDYENLPQRLSDRLSSRGPKSVPIQQTEGVTLRTFMDECGPVLGGWLLINGC